MFNCKTCAQNAEQDFVKCETCMKLKEEIRKELRAKISKDLGDQILIAKMHLFNWRWWNTQGQKS